jgi:hypothetical protein
MAVQTFALLVDVFQDSRSHQKWQLGLAKHSVDDTRRKAGPLMLRLKETPGRAARQAKHSRPSVEAEVAGLGQGVEDFFDLVGLKFPRCFERTRPRMRCPCVIWRLSALSKTLCTVFKERARHNPLHAELTTGTRGAVAFYPKALFMIMSRILRLMLFATAHTQKTSAEVLFGSKLIPHKGSTLG